MMGELAALRHDLNLDGSVVFLGHVPRSTVWQVMKAAAVYVSLSAFEGCPNAVLEAMACGCPLAISDIPGHREIADDTCAAFIRPISSDQTADVVLKVLSDSSLSGRRAEAARLKIEGWGTSAMAKGYEEIYEKLTGN